MYDFPFKLRAKEEPDASDDVTVEADENSNKRTASIDQPDGLKSLPPPSPASPPGAPLVSNSATNHNAVDPSSPVFKALPGVDVAMEELAAAANLSTPAKGGKVDDERDVDILIHIPEYKSEGWLEEWSDISDYEEPTYDEGRELQTQVV